MGRWTGVRSLSPVAGAAAGEAGGAPAGGAKSARVAKLASVSTAPRAQAEFSLEPVFAGVFGVLVGGDELTGRIVAGGLCIVVAMYLVELAPRVSGRAGR